MSPQPRQKVKTPQPAEEAEATAITSTQHTPSRTRSVTQPVTPRGQAKKKAPRQDQESCTRSLTPQTSTPTCRPAAAPHPTPSPRGSRDVPIEITSEDESPFVSIAKRPKPTSAKTTPSSGRAMPPADAAGVALLTVKARSVSDPLPRLVAKPFRDNDASVKELIQGPSNVKEKKERGFVYVLTAFHQEKRVVKIGQTTHSADQRKRAIEQTCSCIRFDCLSVGGSEESPRPHLEMLIDRYYVTVEKLAQKELRRFRYRFDCCCGKAHAEYFDIDYEVACRVVHRWIRFCEAAPWHAPQAARAETGAGAGQKLKLKLKDEWNERLALWWRKEHPDGCRPTKAEDLEVQLARWDRFVDATWWDWLWYDVCVWSEYVSRFRWETLSVLLCVVIRFLVQDRGLFAKLAEWMMLVIIGKLGGFRSVAAEGVIEPLLMAWASSTAVLKEAPDNRMRNVSLPGTLVGSDDDDEGDRDGMDDAGDGDEGDGEEDRREDSEREADEEGEDAEENENEEEDNEMD
ncbi:hypothetical protein N657DRAFT_674489 [Parathielavia appendiculata]|uniref:Bacteriophage T5 Orf172 DNA-binding domain-containing protein n=1 Tax=Parathielavia appendiculata TaxID=2587402 RepID=A0AAN6TT00_9PEZI|nr:hypothetical protein N657DRAFT_674489 [Parathielavia appendiculata]